MPVEAQVLATEEKRGKNDVTLLHGLTALAEKPFKQKLEPVAFLNVALKIDFPAENSDGLHRDL